MAALTLLFACAYFWCLGSAAINEDTLSEGWYATVSKEMAASGDYLVPTYLGEPFFEKPPLFFWCQAASFRIFGPGEFAVRFPSAVFGLLTVLATYCFAARAFDPQTGLLAASMLGTTLLMLGMSRLGMMDSLFTLLMSTGLFAFYGAIHDGETRCRKWFWLFAACLGLACLAKGPMGIAIPLVIAGLYMGLVGGRAQWKQWPLASSALLAAAIAMPWFVAMVALHRWQFIDMFLIKHHLQRISSSTPDEWSVQPFWFYGWVVPVFFLPWTSFLLAAVGASLARGRMLFFGKPRISLFLLLWAGSMLAMLSLAKGKWYHYPLPFFPALAVLTAAYAGQQRPNGAASKPFLAAAVLSTIAMVAAGTFVFRRSGSVAAVPIGVGLLAGGILAGAALAMRRAHLVPWAILGPWCCVLLALIWGRTSENQETQTMKPLAMEINRLARPCDEVCIYHPSQPGEPFSPFAICHQAMTFYLEPPARLARNEGDLRRAMASSGRVFYVVDEATLARTPLLQVASPYLIAKRPRAHVLHRLRAAAGGVAETDPAVLVISNRCE